MGSGRYVVGVAASVMVLAGACLGQRIVGGGANLPQNIADERGNQWMIYQSGMLRQQTVTPQGAHFQFYQQAALMQINGTAVSQNQNVAQVDPKTGEIVISGLRSPGGVEVRRHIYVNRAGSYVRYIDVFRNVAGGEQNLKITYSSNLSYGFQQANVLEDPQRRGQHMAVVAPVPINVGEPYTIVEVYAGRGVKQAPAIVAQQNTSQISASLDVRVPAGKEVAVMHLHGLSSTLEVAERFVRDLRESAVLADVPASLRRAIVNWRGAAGFVGDTELLRGETFDVVEMRSGDILQGTLKEEGYRLETFYGTIELPVDRVVGLINVGTYRPRQLLVTSDGEIFGGKLESQAIRLELASGQVTAIPLGQIARMGYRKRPGEPDDWTFDRPMVVMRSGDRMNVHPPAEPIEVLTRYGAMKLTPQVLAAAIFQSEEHAVHQIILSDGSRLAGLVNATSFDMKLAEGGQVVTFPAASMMVLQVSGQAPEPAIDAPALRLINNDTLVGTLQGQLRIATSFDTLVLNAAEVRWMAPAPGPGSDMQVRMWDETTVSGQLESQEVECLTTSGVSLKVPVALIQEYTQPQPRPSQAIINRVKELVAELGAEDWRQRERAETDLAQMGPVVLGLLKELKPSQGPEAQQRIEAVIQELEKSGSR